MSPPKVGATGVLKVVFEGSCQEQTQDCPQEEVVFLDTCILQEEAHMVSSESLSLISGPLDYANS